MTQPVDVIASICVARDPSANPSVWAGSAVTIDARFRCSEPVSGVRIIVTKDGEIPVALDQADLFSPRENQFLGQLTFLVPGEWKLRAECQEPSFDGAEMTLLVKTSGVYAPTAPGTPLLLPGGLPILTNDPQGKLLTSLPSLPSGVQAFIPVVRADTGRAAQADLSPYMDAAVSSAALAGATAGAASADLVINNSAIRWDDDSYVEFE